MKTLSIRDSFSEYTGLRHCNISDNSGEEFYHNVLNKAFKECYENKEVLIVILDKVDGYASSFLDEAFGNLVYDFTLEIVKQYVEIVSEEEPHWKEMIETKTFKQWEERRRKNERPKVTMTHEPWFRIAGKEIKSEIWETSSVG
jgi:phosphatidylserine/phosphatidylglycerophosphate/cardiolipin synthase-like enzyme